VWTDEAWRENVWRPAVAAAGEAGVNPHDFRHSWVSHMRAARIDVADVAAAAGHSVETATRVYTHSMGGSYELMAAAVGD
jgi:integrase